MSWLSSFLHLDSRPAVLTLLNDAGHLLATDAARFIPATLPESIGVAIDKGIGAAVDKTGMDPNEAGLLKLILSNEIKPMVDKELKKWEPVSEGSHNMPPAATMGQNPATLAAVTSEQTSGVLVGGQGVPLEQGGQP